MHVISSVRFLFPVNGSTGMLRDPEGAGGQLALQDLRARCSPQVLAVSQEGWCHEADPERHQVGSRQLCSVDSRGRHGSAGSVPLLSAAVVLGERESDKNTAQPSVCCYSDLHVYMWCFLGSQYKRRSM